MPEFATVLQEIISSYHTTSWLVISSNSKTFFCVEKRNLPDIDLPNLRRALLHSLDHVACMPRLVQVVGDSGTAFHGDGVTRAQSYIASIVDGNTALEYGYTGKYQDTNWIVNQILLENAELASRSIANIVDQSIEVLNDSEWQGSDQVGNIVFLYSRDRSGPTRFGDDTILSDEIMTAESADRIVCLEGGLQAFRQCANALANGIHVSSMSNLRQSTETRFSAARCLSSMREGVPQAIDAYLNSCNLNDQQLDDIKIVIDRLLALNLPLEELVELL